ncbi:MAG: hypothetical protein EU539_08615 [Promethearchaeota archaeon]|nr:MAG: hypothetical protein EU539_08615 [Candidatus Lokiarchaeota archaeon]
MIFDFILMVISIAISSYAIVYVVLHAKNFGSRTNVLLIVLIYLFVGIFYFVLLSLLTTSFFNVAFALLHWNILIIISISAIGFLSSLHSVVIGYKNIKILTLFIFTFLGGIIISLTINPDSLAVSRRDSQYFFIFQNQYLYIFIILLDITLLSLMWFILMKNYKKIRDVKLARLLFLNTSCFSFIILTYSLFLITQNIILKYIHLIFYIFTALLVLYEIIRKPHLFIELTNKIYEFIIFHKSGILLYSFNFETGRETEDSILKGSILIGINHILSNLSTQRDKLRIIKMQNRDIVLEFDPIHGYAIMLITNKRNDYIENAIREFMENFLILNENKLNSLNGLIDTSEFKNTGKLIEKHFKPYLL